MDRDICLGNRARIIRIWVGEGKLRCLVEYDYSLREWVILLT